MTMVKWIAHNPCFKKLSIQSCQVDDEGDLRAEDAGKARQQVRRCRFARMSGNRDDDDGAETNSNFFAALNSLPSLRILAISYKPDYGQSALQLSAKLMRSYLREGGSKLSGIPLSITMHASIFDSVAFRCSQLTHLVIDCDNQDHFLDGDESTKIGFLGYFDDAPTVRIRQLAENLNDVGSIRVYRLESGNVCADWWDT
ncbi:hypothetical protein HK097_000735 [Rhizophlyctis rosea]|uniref:Uncharacterized protein n=1 Tax=Rhizophlyctis rosea TaxID=64517 RepID=A0AAD5SGC6_9FUNG|nr:hypothetical protein HK097_000735 [Rhizophlyctis rosea]